MNIDIEKETWRLVDVHCDGEHPGEKHPWFDDWSTLDQFILICDFVAFISKYKYDILLTKRRGL